MLYPFVKRTMVFLSVTGQGCVFSVGWGWCTHLFLEMYPSLVFRQSPRLGVMELHDHSSGWKQPSCDQFPVCHIFFLSGQTRESSFSHLCHSPNWDCGRGVLFTDFTKCSSRSLFHKNYPIEMRGTWMPFWISLELSAVDGGPDRLPTPFPSDYDILTERDTSGEHKFWLAECYMEIFPNGNCAPIPSAVAIRLITGHWLTLTNYCSSVLYLVINTIGTNHSWGAFGDKKVFLGNNIIQRYYCVCFLSHQSK